MLELVKGRINTFVQVLRRTGLTGMLNRSDRSECLNPVSKPSTGVTGLPDRSDRLVADNCVKCFNLQD